MGRSNVDGITIDVTSFNVSVEDGEVPMEFVQSIDVQSAMDEFFTNVVIDDITSVTYSRSRSSGGTVIAALVPEDVAESVGYVAIIDAEEQEIVNILELTDCYLPDHVTTTSDGDHIIIVCEGEPDDNDTEFPEFNPPGSVAIVDEDDNVFNANFETYDEGGHKDLPDGVYLPYPDQPFSINAEPENLVVDANDEYVYITLQENNAIAVLDIGKKKIIRLYALGTIDYSETGLDASDKDGTINIDTYSNLYGLRMPDAIDFVEIDGTEYIITANEGDAKDFQESRVEDLELDPVAFPDADELQKEENLGRLKVLNQVGINEDGQYEELYTLSSRDFTIWEVVKNNNGKIRRLELAYSSLDEFEQETAAALGTDGFNSRGTYPSFDGRSDNKGPEPEGIVVGKCMNDGVERVFAFIALEEVGGIMVYDITDPEQSKFVQYFNDRNFQANSAEEEGDTAPEELRFIEEDVYRVPLLFATFTGSSSISVYTVDCSL